MNATNGIDGGSLKSYKLSPLVLLFLSAILAVSFVCYYAANQFNVMLAADSMTAHSYKVMRMTRNVEMRMMSLEMNLRSYLLSGNDSYVGGWKRDVGMIKGEITTLSRLVRENPAQSAKVNQLSAFIDSRIALLNKVSGLKSEDALLSSDIDNMLRNEFAFSGMTQTADEIATLENSELKQRNMLLYNNVATAQKMIVMGMLAGVTVLLLSFIFLRRHQSNNCVLKDGEISTHTDAQRIIGENNELRQTNDKLNVDLEEMKDRNEKISLLLEMSDIMLASSEMSEMSELIAKYCSKVLNFSRGVFYIMHSSKNYLEASSCWGMPNAQTSNFAADKCWALRMGHIYDANSVDVELVCDHAKQRTSSSDKFSSLCIPLRAQNDIYGLLYVEIVSNNEKEVVLSHNDRMLVYGFTEVAALAMANIQLRASLMHQSLRDPLTSLYNRRYLLEFLTKQIYQCERTKSSLAVLMIDVDFFKKVNDIYGHDAGDIVLKELSQLFINHVRPGDVACRYGGEEFILVLYNINDANAASRADKLRHEVSLLTIKYGAQLLSSISISVGVSIYPIDGVTIESLIEKADGALYFAKNSGRNKVIMSSEINTTS